MTTNTLPTPKAIAAANNQGCFATSVPAGEAVPEVPVRQAAPAYKTRSYVGTDEATVEEVIQGVKEVQAGWSEQDERARRTGSATEVPLGVYRLNRRGRRWRSR